MTIQVNITVGNITSTLAAGYTHVKVYRSVEELTEFIEITTPSSIVPLQAGISSYTFLDGSGTTEHWYQNTFFDSTLVVAETVPSTSFQGVFLDTNFSPITYPEEAVFTSRDRYIIDRLRNIIGDPKEINHDYVSTETGYSSISVDKRTHTLSNPKGWPLKVSLDAIEYITIAEPRINGYQFVTFSGTQISTISGSLDVWYYHFRNSDAEILRVFNGLTPPPPLTAEQMTLELVLVCAALEILESEFRLFGATSGSEVDIFQEIRINPKGGLDGRSKDLDSLRKRKISLIAEIIIAETADIYGVLVD